MKNLFKKLKFEWLAIGYIGIFSLLILLLLTKGNVRNNTLLYQNGSETNVAGPLELSNTTSRYVLTEAIVQNKSFLLTLEQAKVGSPDVVFYKGKYFTVFTPGVSFLGVPFYIIGKYLGAPQILTFLMNVFLAVINLFLVFKVAKKLGANTYAALLSGFIFTFATNALGYTFTFTQHEASTTFILLALLNSIGKRTIVSNITFGLIVTAGALMDIPNVMFMIPMALYIASKHFSFESVGGSLKINFKWIALWFVVGFIPLLLLFGWYNYQVAGSATKLAQNIGRVENVGQKTAIQNKETPTVVSNTLGQPLLRLPFQTRGMLNGLYILALSDERSWLFYSPVLFFGIAGLIFAYKKTQTTSLSILLISVIALNIVLYSMFGDPWGGWSFGARYLIPSASLMAAATGVFLTRFRRNYLASAFFGVLFAYSIYVNTLGAITTNAIPPKVEAVNFKPPLDYTYDYNLNFVERNQSSTLLYNAVLKNKMPLATFLYVISGILIVTGFLQYGLLIRGKERNGN